MPIQSCPKCKARIESETLPERCPSCRAILVRKEVAEPAKAPEPPAEILPWEERFCIGHDLIDAQHRELCGLINELYRAVRFQQYREGFVMRVITRTEDYVRKHFAEEEKLFGATDYPHKEMHMAEHREFLKWFLDLRAKSKESIVDLKPVLKHFVEWFIRHVQTLDRGYKPYVK